MALTYENSPLSWGNNGTVPSEESKKNGYTAGEKLPASHLNYLIKNKELVEKELQTKLSDLHTTVDTKVDKVSGKGLSTNDYTTAEKNKLAGIATGATANVVENVLTSTSTTNALSAAQGKALNDTKLPLAGGTITGNLTVNGTFTNTALNTTIANKVDKVSGKQLSTNDYTTAEKTKLTNIAEGANKTVVENVLTSTSTTNALSAAQGKALNDSKVDKVSGKQLSTNDYTTTEKNKLAGIATGANNTTIVNNLTSTSTTSALSAAQGKVLNEKFVELSPDDATAVQTINSPVTINGVLRSAQGQIYYATSSGATLSTNNLSLTIAAKDTCAINATTTQLYNIAARGSNAYDIGTSSVRFKNIYLVNSPNVSSDGRAKKDICDVNNEELVDFINKINICNFKYKDDETEKERIGVIAQQLIEANPKVADYFVEHDPEADFYSVKPADLVYPLISYVQYLEKRIEKLEGTK